MRTMIKRWVLGCLCAVLVGLAGCGGGSSLPYTDNSRDPEALATNLKQVVLTAVYEAKDAREPADALAMIVTAFDGNKRRQMPVGSYGPIYDELAAVATQWYEACESADGRAPGLEGGLAQLEELAAQLPGDVEALK
jgi:hypothetical protein